MGGGYREHLHLRLHSHHLMRGKLYLTPYNHPQNDDSALKRAAICAILSFGGGQSQKTMFMDHSF